MGVSNCCKHDYSSAQKYTSFYKKAILTLYSHHNNNLNI